MPNRNAPAPRAAFMVETSTTGLVRLVAFGQGGEIIAASLLDPEHLDALIAALIEARDNLRRP